MVQMTELRVLGAEAIQDLEKVHNCFCKGDFLSAACWPALPLFCHSLPIFDFDTTPVFLENPNDLLFTKSFAFHSKKPPIEYYKKVSQLPSLHFLEAGHGHSFR